MTLLSSVLDKDALAYEIAEGYVKRNRHPKYPLSIYTYNRECQYSGRWNAITTQCRGLVVDDTTDEIIGRPFPKFFNVGEHGVRDYAAPLPSEPFSVYEKVDGSLGILYNYDGLWHIASKGSFISDQAQWAQRYIDGSRSALMMLPKDLTYCAEIVYPQNRIVVNYGDREDLVLLAAFRPDGTEIPLSDVVPLWRIGSVVKSYEAPTLDHLVARTQESVSGADAEGFVVRFASGLRAKAKFIDYVRLHKLMTGITERDVWRAMAFDHLRDLGLKESQLVRTLRCSPTEIKQMAAAPKGAIASIIDNVPDEFDQWVRAVQDRIDEDVSSRFAHAGFLFQQLANDVGTADRGTFARALQTSTNDKTVMSACFAMLDKQPSAPVLWRSCYPEASAPFREDDEG